MTRPANVRQKVDFTLAQFRIEAIATHAEHITMIAQQVSFPKIISGHIDDAAQPELV